MRTLSLLMVAGLTVACGEEEPLASTTTEPTEDLAQDPPPVDTERPAAIEYEEEPADTDTAL